MFSVNKLLLTVLFCMEIPVSALAEDVPGSIDWYRNPENKAALEAKLQECSRMSESARKANEECNNARLADIQGEKFEKVKEPTFGF